MESGVHLHFHIRVAEPIANNAVTAILALMQSLKIESSVAGKIEAAPCSMTRSIGDWQADMERRGCKSTSVKAFGSHVTRFIEHTGWSSPDQITLAGAIEYLGARRKAGWSGPTHDGAVSALKNFGAFLAKTSTLATNPLEHLEASGETGGQGARALNLEEARSLVGAAIARAARTGKDKSHAAMFYAVLLHTGLRYAEASSLMWGDLDLDADVPVLVSNPAWSKNGRREIVPLHSELHTLLREHRKIVRDGPENKVFPHAPNRHTFDVDREAAGIKRTDARGRNATYHSTRKYLATQLDRTGASPGVVSRILRHADTLAEARYIDHDLSAEVAAMQRLPNLWAQKWGNVLESGREAADTHSAKAMRMNTPTTSSPSSAVREQLPGLSNRPCSSQRTALDRLGFESAPLSQDTAAHSCAFQHGNGQSRACAQSSLIAALEAQARAVLAMCEALREESPV